MDNENKKREIPGAMQNPRFSFISGGFCVFEVLHMYYALSVFANFLLTFSGVEA